MQTSYNLFGEVVVSKETKLVNHNDDFKINGLSYIANFITKSEHDFLLTEIDKQPWLSELKRRVQHYGYKYDYKFHRINHSMKISELPEWLQNFAIRLKQQGLFKEIPDQVIVNEYLPGQGITNHIDCPPCFSDTIASLSLGSRCVMNFTNKDDETEVIPYLLDVNSIVVLKEDARYSWMHGIKLVKTDNYFGHKIKRERRVSLTFRKVILD
jgi:alkylated DNA repair dioxygenase AlkB